MPRGGDPDDLEDDPVEEDEGEPDEEPEETEEPRPSPRRPPPRIRRRGSSKAPRPVKPWTISDLDEEESERTPAQGRRSAKTDDGEGFFASLRRPVFFRARDSWYFEPLVALAIIVLLLVGLYAFTSNWPPIYVVESNSMQHGPGDTVGLINAGDLVLVQKVGPASIVTYTDGEQTGFSTYGEYGDVLLYHPNGATDATPIIHRALLYLEWSPSAGDYSAPSLQPLACGSEPGAVYSIAGSPTGCGWSGLITTITLYHVGWRNLTVSIPLGGMARYSGFVTLGDNNTFTDQAEGLSALVQPGWVIGVARGMVPWVGAFKLLIDGNAQYVPARSWQFLALTISAIALGAYGLHYLFRVEGIEDPRRREEERAAHREREEDEEGGPSWADHPKGSRWHGLREWLAAPEEEDEEEPSPPPAARRKPTHAAARKRATPAASSTKSRGRPRPAVRKTKGFWSRRSAQRSSKSSDDDTL